MEDIKTNQSKRIKHCYRREELYHRFIHSEEYAYSPANGKQISCKGNYLFTGDIGKSKTIETIENIVFPDSRSMIAIIDRQLNRILINKRFRDYAWEIRRAIPDYYEIYYTNNYIHNKDVLLATKAVLKIHAKYLIEEFSNDILTSFHRILDDKTRTAYQTFDTVQVWSTYKDIIKFVKDNKLKQYSFYKECFDDNYTISYYSSYNNIKTKQIKLPTLQQIVNGTFITKKQKLIIEQKYFYTQYCFGNGISFKDVVNNWNKTISYNDIIDYLTNKSLYFAEECFKNITEHTWNNYIKTAVEIDKKVYENYIAKSLEKSKENYLKALEQQEKQCVPYTINDWRNNKSIPNNRIQFEEFITPKRRNSKGTWRIRSLYQKVSLEEFKNVQLRLKNGKIETSKNAVVSLEEGIKMYKLFVVLREKYVSKLTYTSDDFGSNIKVGIYNLRFITYKNKVTDNGCNLGYKEWLIQIGCHSIWLDDIYDFIHYFKLEEKFGITQNKSNVKLKINLKK